MNRFRLPPAPLAALALVLAGASDAFAVPAELEYAPPTSPAPPDMAGLLVRLVALTLGLLVICAGVLWGVRRATQPRGVKGDGGGRLKHEGSLALDRRSALHLIRVDGQTVAVTTDATGLRSMVLLSEPFESALDEAKAEVE